MTVARPGRRAACLLAASALLGWLSIRNAAILLFATARPTLAEAFWPASGTALAADARARVLAAGGVAGSQVRTLARAALVRSPASDAPLVLHALAASGDGDLRRASALMTAAVARNPRNDVARYWLFDHAIRTGDYAAGLAQVGPALRLREGTRGPILALVAGLLDIPAAAPAVRAILATDPDWRTGFFQTQATAGTDPARLAELLLGLPPPRRPGAPMLEQRAVLYAAINRGQFALAHDVWRATLRTPSGLGMPPAPGATVYDPDFAGLPGAPPFNWSLQPGEGATAAMVTHSHGLDRTALAITFHGTVSAVVAEQYIVAKPGAYTLSLRTRAVASPVTSPVASPVASSVDARLFARVRCASDDALLAQLPIALQTALVAASAPVTVPQDCAALRLQLAGEPGERVGIARAELTAFHLDPR